MKRWLCAALGAAWVGVCAPGCGAPEDPEAEVPELYDDGKADQPAASDGRVYHLRRDLAAVPRKVRVDETTIATAGGPERADPVSIAHAFLRKNAGFFRLQPDLSDLRVAAATETTVDLQQMVEGRPLFGAGFRIELDERWRLALAYNRYLSPPPAPVSAASLAREQAMAAAGLGGAAAVAELGWVLDAGGRALPAWQIEDGAVRVLVDAASGSVLWQDDLRRDLTGRGLVYTENAFVDPRPREEPLYGLNASDGSLGSRNVVVRGPPGTAVDGVATGWQYDFAPGSPEFGQVMAYYHLDGVARWLEALGFTPRRRALPVYTQAFAQLNAYFDPRADGIFLGATRDFDLADDADVMVHEYGHVVVHAYAPGLLARRFAAGDAALHEAYADYLACAYFGDPLMAEAFHIELWRRGDALAYLHRIGFDPRQPGRRCDADRRWPDHVDSDPHVSGMIVSGALWDLRMDLVQRYGLRVGGGLADALAIGAITHLARSNNDFVDVLEAMLEADRRTTAGHQARSIRAAFARHGIATGARVELHRGLPWPP